MTDPSHTSTVDTARRIEYMALDTVPTATRNPRTHDIPSLVSAIRRFGVGAPVVLDERTGRLLAGHGRLLALARIRDQNHPAPEGIEIVDGSWCVPVYRGWASLDDAHADAMLVADNRITENAGWNERELAQMLAELNDQSLDLLHATGFGGDDLRRLLAATDDTGTVKQGDAFTDEPATTGTGAQTAAAFDDDTPTAPAGLFVDRRQGPDRRQRTDPRYTTEGLPT